MAPIYRIDTGLTVLVPTLRLYCEMVPAARLLEPAWRNFLAGFRERVRPLVVELVLKVLLPGEEGRLEDDVEALLSTRTLLPVDRLVLWGQLRNREAVYLNSETVAQVAEGWRRLESRCDFMGWRLEGALLDMEPNLTRLQGLTRLDASAYAWLARGARESLRAATDELDKLIASLGARCDVVVARPPLSVLGSLGPAFARHLGLVADVGKGAEISEMAYTSFLLPALGTVVGPQRAWSSAGRAAGVLARAHTRGEGRRSVICGTCGIGLLGTEPCYPHARAMRPQVRAVAQARPHALGVFNLLGIASDGRGYRDGLQPDEARWTPWADMLRDELSGP